MAEQFPRPTNTYRASSYPAISPTRPELSVNGQTVLITGGATGIGLETSKAFAAGGAGTIVLVARDQDRMTEAKKSIEATFPSTKVVTHAVSVDDHQKINSVMEGLGAIDILVLNAGFLPKPQGILDTDFGDMQNVYAVNVLGPLNMIKTFMKLKPTHVGTPRTVIYTSAWGINSIMPGVSAYSSSKAAMTYIMRAIGEEYAETGVRTFAFHPCVAYTNMAKNDLGLPPNAMKWDDLDLPAHYAVWLCSTEADYLKGRFLSANWDVEELAAKKEEILRNPSLLKVEVQLGDLRG